MATKASAGKKVTIRQTRSFIGRDREFRGTLKALGLGKIGSTCEHTASPAIMGMIRRVHSVVEVTTA